MTVIALGWADDPDGDDCLKCAGHEVICKNCGRQPAACFCGQFDPKDCDECSSSD